MKKFTVVFAAAVMAVSLSACGAEENVQAPETDTEVVTEVEEANAEADAEAEAVAEAEEDADTTEESDVTVMSYAEFVAADVDTEVVVETYVQAKQGWWNDTATIYTQDGDGAYFLYSMPCSKEDYDKLTTGTKIKVTGHKSEWSGEVEIVDATFEIEKGNYVAKAIDVTSLLASDELISKQNMFVSFKGLTVEAQDDGSAFLYNWDGSGSHDDNSDLYFNVSVDGKTYTFTVESYLCGNDTEVYKAVEGLKVGDKIDAEGFLYWYNGVNPHITKISK